MTTEKIVLGTPITWKPSAGTYAMAGLTSLAAGAARIGARGDLGNGFPREMLCTFTWKFAVAPTAGQFVNLYLAWSDALTGNGSAGYSEADAAITGATLLVKAPQFTTLNYIAVDAVTATHYVAMPVYPLARYVQPVVYNATSQAFSATAGDHIFTLTPRWGMYVI